VGLSLEIIVLPEVDAKDWEEVIRILGKTLLDRGYVKDTYIDATIEREKKCPTGLELAGGINVSLPHADIEHVLQPAMAVARLKHEVEFKRMDDYESSVMVKMVFMPAITNPRSYVQILKRLTTVFKNPEEVKKLSEASPEELKELLAKALLSEEEKKS